ncbi:restriction endonuclease subunit S [Citrobacter cronae]|jgi:type I restriction enzyme S subunit|uniref:restriction endonuclease subunit S n=1 Tax=Citrobacter cronae TaxID=1748967 RepID=UPI00351D0A4C
MSNAVSFLKYGDVAEFRNGLNFSKDSHGKGCKFIGVADFKDNFTPQWELLGEINPSGVARKEDYLESEDIIFVRSNGNKALVGRSLFIDSNEKSLYSGFCIRARLKTDDFLPLFLAYYTQTEFFKSAITSVAGTNINNLNQDILSNVMIPHYSIEVQKSIVDVLSSIDAKIALNNRINAELEAMAKSLYDYWFVQFDFPDDNGKPYKTSGGKMMYNATLKRDIPVGWNLKPILECCDVIDCLHSKKPESNYFSNEHYLLQLENIEDNGLLDMSVKYFVSHEDYINWTSRIEVKQHDIVMTNAGRIAAFAQIPEGIKCGIGRNITAIRPKNIKKNYFFSALSGIDIQSQIAKNLDHGAFFKSFNVKGIKLLKIIKTDNGLEDKFESLITPVIEKRQQVQHENQMLKELRDWLLPLLMNGQVTVK